MSILPVLVPQPRREVRGMNQPDVVGLAVEAQQAFAHWPEQDVDELLGALARQVARRARELAVGTVQETGMGNVADKTRKIIFASTGVQATLRGWPAAGVLHRDRRRRLVEVATPVGVVLALMPVTSPVATLIFTTLIALKGRNALLVSPHHRARGVSLGLVDDLRTTLQEHGAPRDLLQGLGPDRDREQVSSLMRAPQVALVLATGGPAVVRAAYSSGTPAIGVGPGNAPAWVARDAAITEAAAAVISSKSFDNGIICGSEQHLVVDEHVVAPFTEALRRAGAAVLTPEQVTEFERLLFDPSTGRLLRHLVGLPAPALAAAAQVAVHPATRLLVAPLADTKLRNPWVYERLAPLVPLRSVPDVPAALALCRALLQAEGAGHTVVVHTKNRRLAAACATELPASRVLVNTPSSQGCIGLGNGLTPSFTLGCGTAGGTSTTDNVSYTKLLNIVRIAQPSRHHRLRALIDKGLAWSLRPAPAGQDRLISGRSQAPPAATSVGRRPGS